MKIIFNPDGWAERVYDGNPGATFVQRAGAVEVPYSDNWRLYKLVDGTPTLQTAETKLAYDRSVLTWDAFYSARESIIPFVTGYFGTLTVVNITSEQRDELETWWQAICDAPETLTPATAFDVLITPPEWWRGRQSHASIYGMITMHPCQLVEV